MEFIDRDRRFISELEHMLIDKMIELFQNDPNAFARIERCKYAAMNYAKVDTHSTEREPSKVRKKSGAA